MDLLVIRHAVAEDKELFALTGRSDDLRPLTAPGRAKMRRAAVGLREIAPRPALIATSPLTRARETAEIVAAALRGPTIETIESLRPDRDCDEFLAWITQRVAADDLDTIAIVGHEPHLGGLVTWLMTGFGQPRVELKKGAACLLRFEGAPRAGEATLRWSLSPSHLRRVGDQSED